MRRRERKFREKLNMYDTMIANLLTGNTVMDSSKKMDSSQISIEYSSISSETQLSKYFLIKGYPDYMDNKLMDIIRLNCIQPGVRINFYLYGESYKINWNSQEMRNRMSIWKNYTSEITTNDIFSYRDKRNENLAKERILWSTKYLNESELDNKRSLLKVVILVEISSKRDETSILNLIHSINNFKALCTKIELKHKELKVNMIDWLSYLGVFSLRAIKEVLAKTYKKVLTDDILANFNGYKQGRIGYEGVPLGIDILSMVPVLKKLKADPEAPENWLISATTGGGKSYFVKTLITYLLSEFVVTVMDYEGDEYYNLANYIKAGNPKDVLVISMGKGTTVYFDPMEISDLTGDPDIDNELKQSAMSYTMALFRIIINGVDNGLTQWEERIISIAIKRVYEEAQVTEDKNTWVNSRGLRLKMVYAKIKEMALSKEFVDEDMDNIKHKAAMKIYDAASMYFEEGEAKAGTFKQPMSVNELYRAKFIVFSFGMRGLDSSQIDPVELALKQLSVANVSMQVSNYCKYIKKTFNVKVWEEYQRWGQVKGSAEIISNAMTGGRKRGDINFLITNDLGEVLDEENPLYKRLRQNISSYAIGKINDQNIIKKFCETFIVPELEEPLKLISKTSIEETNTKAGKVASHGAGNRYKHAFCLLLDNGKKCITKVMSPPDIRNSSIFKIGGKT